MIEKIPEEKALKVRTVGEQALSLQQAEPLDTDSIELQKEIHKGSGSKRSYEEEIFHTVDRGCRDSQITGDFFLVVLFKKERHLQNIVRQYFFYRQSCPTPEFDQTVYKYHRKEDKVEYLWTVPDNVSCINLPLMRDSLPPEQYPLLDMIVAFKNGSLERRAALLNKEVIFS